MDKQGAESSQDAKKLRVACEIEKIEREKLTTKLQLSWKDGKLVAGSYKDLPFLK